LNQSILVIALLEVRLKIVRNLTTVNSLLQLIVNRLAEMLIVRSGVVLGHEVAVKAS
jgi:hypothetical protein